MGGSACVPERGLLLELLPCLPCSRHSVLGLQQKIINLFAVDGKKRMCDLRFFLWVFFLFEQSFSPPGR